MAPIILTQLVNTYPLISIFFFSLIITLILTLAYKKFTNQQEMGEMKAKTKELQKRIKEEKDQEKIMALQKEMLQLSMEQMRHNMKPMLITLPLIAISLMALRFSDVKWFG